MTDAAGAADGPARGRARDVDPASADAGDADPRPTVIRLGQFLKLAGLAASGGEAKLRIGDGDVLVNGAVETRRRRQLRNGDVVTVDGVATVVDLPEDGGNGPADAPADGSQSTAS